MSKSPQIQSRVSAIAKELVSVLPDDRVRRITYDMDYGDKAPEPGDYLVSMSSVKEMPTNVYQVCSARKVKSEKYNNRYSLEVIRRTALLEKVQIIETSFGCTGVRVAGKDSFTLYWSSRNKS